MSFGFSVGDFIAISKLISEISSCLQSAGGARSDFQELTRELHSLQTALCYLDRLDNSTSSSRKVQSIKSAALACRYPLEQFLASIRPYEATLGARGRSSATKTTQDKLRWTLGRKDEIDRLRNYLSIHMDVLNNLLIQHGLEHMDSLHKAAQESALQLRLQFDDTKAALGDIQQNSAQQAVILHTVHTKLRTLCDVVCGEMIATLQHVAHVVNTICVSTQQMYAVVLEIRDTMMPIDTRFTYFQEPYRVEDARGHVFPVPSEYSFEELQNIITYKFRTGIGAYEVWSGNYELRNTKRRSVGITKTNCLRPGMAITMAIILAIRSANSDINAVCSMPCCKSSNIAAFAGDGFKCLDCDVWFDEARRKWQHVGEAGTTKYLQLEREGLQPDDERTAEIYSISGIRNVTWALPSIEDRFRRTLHEVARRNNYGRVNARQARILGSWVP